MTGQPPRVRVAVCVHVCVCLQADQGVMWRKAHIRYMRGGGKQPAAVRRSITSTFNNLNPLQSSLSGAIALVSDV